jgi:hypothetical protein
MATTLVGEGSRGPRCSPFLEDEVIIDVWVVKGFILDVKNGGVRGLLEE